MNAKCWPTSTTAFWCLGYICVLNRKYWLIASAAMLMKVLQLKTSRHRCNGNVSSVFHGIIFDHLSWCSRCTHTYVQETAIKTEITCYLKLLPLSLCRLLKNYHNVNNVNKYLYSANNRRSNLCYTTQLLHNWPILHPHYKRQVHCCNGMFHPDAQTTVKMLKSINLTFTMTHKSKRYFNEQHTKYSHGNCTTIYLQLCRYELRKTGRQIYVDRVALQAHKSIPGFSHGVELHALLSFFQQPTCNNIHYIHIWPIDILTGQNGLF